MDEYGEVIDSPAQWVAQHIREYVESEGKKGHRWRGLPTLLLTTRGRRSGKLRRSALIYGHSGSDYVVVGSKGGAKYHPLWYLNLMAEPSVDVQVGPDRFKANARTVSGPERDELWRMMAEIFPTYDTYAQKTERQIPIVVLEPQ